MSKKGKDLEDNVHSLPCKNHWACEGEKKRQWYYVVYNMQSFAPCGLLPHVSCMLEKILFWTVLKRHFVYRKKDMNDMRMNSVNYCEQANHSF